MSSMSFRIYKTPHHNTWILSYKVGTHRHESTFLSKNDAIQASLWRATKAREA